MRYVNLFLMAMFIGMPARAWIESHGSWGAAFGGFIAALLLALIVKLAITACRGAVVTWGAVKRALRSPVAKR